MDLLKLRENMKKNISKDTQEMPQSRNTPFPKHKKSTYKTTDAQTKKHFNRGTTFERSVLKQFLLGARTTSDAAPNYKHMFGTRKGPLPHMCNVTVKRM